MTAALSEELRSLLDTPVFVTVATIQPDGSPQLSPVWVKRDGDDVLFSTTRGRRKEQNLSRDPRVSVVVQPFAAPYTYAEIRGVAALTTEGGDELIDELSVKYTGKKYAEFNPASDDDDDERVVVRITPEKIVGRI
ncbi:PPOX class F420-dependent oxidoreductase [Streptomyces sp900116325]|uniref:PPOX class F420-dependent oxidoreductase n=1 Tax=Streptomyces sp. 900116325 TaxID=3154295 RepID=UPI00340042BA